ncbi:MAG TPA: hypothetical protein VK133_02455 [Amoebophilaceae bacterium]|nr:hypothetical protein [Amoebophilaceae bacterium]
MLAIRYALKRNPYDRTPSPRRKVSKLLMRLWRLWISWNLYTVFPVAAAAPLCSMETYIEQILQRQDNVEEANRASIREILQEAYAAPLDLNQTTQEAVEALGILSSVQITHLFEHMRATGPLYSIYELQAIPSFDLETIRLLRPFVCVTERYDTSSASLLERIIQSKKHYAWLRYEPSLGGEPKPLPPNIDHNPMVNSDKYTSQLFIKPDNQLSLGIVARKQAGEVFTWDHATHRYGCNLWSFFLLVEGKPYAKRLLIGDYQLGYGQGLLLNAGYSFQKGTDCTAIVRTHTVGIRPYKGIQRIGLRGIAIATAWKALEATGFYSSHNLDAHIRLDEENRPYTHRVDPTGRYATLHELQNKGTLHEHAIGCVLLSKNKRNQREVGITLLHLLYDIPILPRATLFTRYAFKGKRSTATGFFYRWTWRNLLLFGEAALSFPDPAFGSNKIGKAGITGALISLSRYVDLSTAFYRYGAEFYSPYGYGFKHYTTATSNEKGWYGCIQFAPRFNWHFSTHVHLFSTLAPTVRLKLPSPGKRMTVRLSHTHQRTTTWGVRYVFTHLPKNKPIPRQEKVATETYQIEPAIRQQVKLMADRKCSTHWWIGFVYQHAHFNFLQVSYPGYALSHRHKWKYRPCQCVVQIIYFDTQSHATRLYFHEPTPLYSGIRYVPYHGTGLSASCLLCWKPIQSMRLEVKYSFVHRFQEKEQPTDPKQKQTNSHQSHLASNQSHAALQLIWRF